MESANRTRADAEGIGALWKPQRSDTFAQTILRLYFAERR